MIVMKKLILLLVMTLNVVFITECHAELFDGSVHFYIKSGDALTASTEIIVVYYDKYNERICKISTTKLKVGQNLQNNQNYYKTEIKERAWGKQSGIFQPSLSTSARDVYGGRLYSTTIDNSGRHDVATNYYIYWGVAKDKSSYIWWKEDIDGNILVKTYYIEVSIEDLIPKAVNREFLYD